MALRKQIHGSIRCTMITAGLGVSLLACRSSWGQYYVGNNGRTAEANNRLGSFGYNGAVQTNNDIPTANNIYMGNVTGLGSFHGLIPYRGSNQFTGFLPPEPSQILDQVAGVASPSSPPTYNKPQVWYAPQKTLGQPAGFEPVNGTGAYVPAPPPGRLPQDYRLGNTLDIPSTSGLSPSQPSGGQPAGGGAPVDPTAVFTPTNLVNAPIYGARILAQGPQGTSYGFISGTGPISSTGESQGLLATNLSQADMFKMRNELATSALTFQNPNSPTAQNAQSGQNPEAQSQTPTGLNAPLPAAPIQTAVGSNAPLQSPNLASQASVSTGPDQLSTGQRTQLILPPLPPAAQQSPEYAKLHQLLQQYESAHPRTDEEAFRLFRQALQARRAYDQSVASSSGKTPGINSQLPTVPRSAVPSGSNPPPLSIGPIGQGIRAAGLKKMVQEAEDLARHQKYKDAIAKFLEARQVDPNYLLITIDLANAELGAGFYSDAEQYLREAFTADPALLMGKYDLTSVIGPDRIEILINDLKRVASTSDTVTPVFLLAYVSYNTGEADKALEYLHMAQTRAGGNDELLNGLMEHWSLPTPERKGAATRPIR